MICECCNTHDSETGQQCDGCGCCCQECCNCTPSDCDCDACVERRTNLNPELGRAITDAERDFMQVVMRHESAPSLSGSFPGKWMFTALPQWREMRKYWGTINPNLALLYRAAWQAGFTINGIKPND